MKGRFHVKKLGQKGLRHFHWHQLRYWGPELRVPYCALSAAYNLILEDSSHLSPSETLDGARRAVQIVLGLQLLVDLDHALIVGLGGKRVPKVVQLAKVLARHLPGLTHREVCSRAANSLNPRFLGLDIQVHP